ncbi:unnamed protein product [Rotaria magnacalcarata]|uniref:Major facilitator superfamily (MFS) profile domain-containing protein n=1 Tax=Rotaria magnacalcarata TaxID=392030 RepID=A0A8S2P2W7_9BILA|nr:unnamed protein product [Rotaria magnacalcarata]CAF4083283.1 unnamed protein product [Rotaria magnacalcarata]
MTSGIQTKNSGASGPIVPDGGWGWIIVFSSFMIHFIMDGITYSMGDVFLHPMMDNLHKARGPVSTIFGILPAITLATGPIATIFTNTYGCRKVTIVGSCLAAVGFLLSYLWANIWFYYLAIGIIGGIGFGLIYLPAIVSVGFYFERKRSFAMGIAVCGSGLGTLAFPAIMPYIINSPLWFGYEGALLLEASVIFICVIFGAFMIPLPQEPSEIRRLERKARIEAKQQTRKEITAMNENNEQQNKLIQNNEKSDIPLEQLTVDDIDINEKSQLDKIVSNEKDEEIFVPRKDAVYQATDANVIVHKRHWIIMSIGISNCFGRVIIGFLADRSWINRLTLYNTTLIIAGISTMFAPFCNSSVATHMIYASLFGFFSGGYVGLTSIIIVDLVGVDKLSDAFGVLLLFQGIAVAIGTPVVGSMRDAFSEFDRPYLWPYLIFGGSILLSGLILFAIPILKRQKERQQKLSKHQLQMGVLSFSKQDLSAPEQQQQI